MRRFYEHPTVLRFTHRYLHLNVCRSVLVTGRACRCLARQISVVTTNRQRPFCTGGILTTRVCRNVVTGTKTQPLGMLAEVESEANRPVYAEIRLRHQVEARDYLKEYVKGV